jgi:hypothetical protein
MSLSTTELSIVLKEAMKKVRIGGTYVHYRAPEKPYAVLHVGLLEETEEPCVIYQALYGDKLIWIRPLSKFLELVDANGEKVQRFKEI